MQSRETDRVWGVGVGFGACLATVFALGVSAGPSALGERPASRVGKVASRLPPDRMTSAEDSKTPHPNATDHATGGRILQTSCCENDAQLHVLGDVLTPAAGGVAAPDGTNYSVHHRVGADLDAGGPQGITCFNIFHFGLPGAPDDIVKFDGIEEPIRTDLLGTVPRVIEFDSAEPNGQRLLSIRSSSPTGTDLFPAGFISGGVPLTDACFSIGLDDALAWGESDVVVAAAIEFLTNGLVELGPLEASAFFLNPWNGVTTITLPGGAGQGYNGVRLTLLIEKTIDVPNDNCREQLQVFDGATDFSTIGAGTDGPEEPALCQFALYSDIASDIWFRYVATCSGNLAVDLCDSGYDTKFAVYPACRQCPIEVDPIACNDDFCGLRSFATAEVVEGECYTIRVGGYLGLQGTGTMNLSCNIIAPPTGACCNVNGGCFGTLTEEACVTQNGTWFLGETCPAFLCPVSPPTNDECTDCIRVLTNSSYSGRTTASSGTDVSSCSQNDSLDVWHCWTADCTGRVNISTCGSGFDTTLSVFDACDGVQLACDDDSCPTNPPNNSSVTLDVTEGTSYFIRVSGYDGRVGNYTLNVGVCKSACCLTSGVCGLSAESQCLGLGGTWLGPGSLCAGDLDGNGINDACEACPKATIADSAPPDGTVDARQPHARNNFLPRQGIGSPGVPGSRRETIVIVLSPPVADAEECFSLCETGADSLLGPNTIDAVTYHGAGVYELVLDHAIPMGKVTTIEFLGDGSSVEYFSHPANVDGGAMADADDITEHIECCLLGNCLPTWSDRSCDIDRSTLVTPADTVFLVDVLNGTQNWTVWNGTPIPANASCP